MAVVIVDGWPTDKVEEASRFARESGINIFFITIEGATENEKQYVTEPNFSNKVWNCPQGPTQSPHPLSFAPCKQPSRLFSFLQTSVELTSRQGSLQ